MKKLNLILLFTAWSLIAIGNAAYAQQGISCEDPFEVVEHDTCSAINLSFQNGGITWVRFTATSSSVAILISTPSGPFGGSVAHIHKVVLLNGDCRNIQLLSEDSTSHESDSLPALASDNLIIGKTYFLQISGFTGFPNCAKCSNTTAYFGLCVSDNTKITAQSTPCSPCGLNLVINGDFETPPTPNASPYQLSGVSSSWMTYSTSFSAYNQTGTYCISNNGVPPFIQPVDIADHTSGTGYFLIGDAESHACCHWPYTRRVWEQDVAVQSGVTYYFSIWLKDVGDDYDLRWAKIKLHVDGHDISPWFDNGSSHTWNQYCYSWTASQTETVNLRILCKGDQSAYGNDFGIDDIQFRASALSINPTITASATTILQNNQVTLTATGGETYLWSNGATTQSITVTPCVTTTYTVNAYASVAGCEGLSASITINVTPLTAAFSSSPTPACVIYQINFTNTTVTGLSTFYLWNFGDNSPVNYSTSPSHTYSTPGTYTVTLTALNACGSSTASIPVNVVPSTSTYNVGCCSSYHAYHFDETTGGPIIITAPLNNPQYWTNQHYFIRGTVTIMPGSKLVIDGSIIEFDPFSKIVVSEGAILEVLNSTLTGLETCGTMWQGIEVWGNKNKSQAAIQNPLTGQLFQGKVLLTNSTVELAHNGIVLGKRQGAIFNSASGGGILQARNSTFHNCGYGIRYIPYPLYFDYGKVTDCNFSCASLPDPGYNISNSYTYPNTANPVYGYANLSQRTYAFVLTIGVKFVEFSGNTFNNSEYGIVGINSSLRVIAVVNGSGNIFLNMNVGEQHANIFTSPFYYNRIESNTYIGPTFPITIYSGIGDRILENKIPQGAFVGIGMSNSQAFFVNDNQVTNCLLGVTSANSGTMGGLIGRTNLGNTFTTCIHSTWLGGNNSFLQVHCNQYINSTNPTVVIDSWKNFGPLANQGFLPIVNDKDPAGNHFIITSPATNQISSTTLFDYYRHSADINGNSTVMTPDPSGVITTGNIINTGFQELNTSCDPYPPHSNFSGLSVMDAGITALETEQTGIESLVDGNKTQDLLDAISSNMTSLQLQDYLIANSPLSDVVVLAYIARTGTPPGNFENVIIPNSPVSREVRPFLLDYIVSLPDVNIDNIIAAQASSNRTLSVVTDELQSSIGKRQSLYNNQQDLYLIGLGVDSTMQDSIYLLLDLQQTEAAKEAIVASRLADENYPSAWLAIEELAPFTPEEIAEKSLLVLLYNIYSEERDVFQMDSSEIALVRTIAELPDMSIARTNARVILFAVFGEPLTPEIDFDKELRLAAPASAVVISTESFLGESYPNPATDEVNIACFVPEGSAALIKFYDMAGKLIHSEPVLSGNQYLTLGVKDWQAGVYMYELIVDNTITAHQKMVITNK
ncbi:MAG: PKD domain-containing protein [Bacteroidia bacterium]